MGHWSMRHANWTLAFYFHGSNTHGKVAPNLAVSKLMLISKPVHTLAPN